MVTQPVQPILQYGSKSRKYGRYDFERFDNRSSTHASIAHSNFHKVSVDCRFLFKKSRWGVLGEDRNPAGIIYLDLTFDQPKGSQLHSATVTVTLEDASEELGKSGSNFPIQLTDCYGPKGFTGPEKTFHTKKSLSFTPNAQFGGFGVGGVGVNKESSLISSSRWKFAGHLLPGQGKHWTYRTLKWDLSENDLEAQSTHNSQVHTAFTFEHGGQPFFMRVEIKGKLKNFHGRVKDKLMKFPSNAKRDDASAVTLIDFGKSTRFTISLDERARELEFEMEMANLNAIPMEISDPQPVTFQRIPQNHMLSSTSNTAAPSEPWNQPQNAISGRRPQQRLPASKQQQLLQEKGEDAKDPILVHLAQAFVDLHSKEQEYSDYGGSTKVSSTTAAENDREIVEREIAEADDKAVSAMQKQDKTSDEQILLQLLKVPAFLTFFRVMMSLLGLFSRTPSLEESPRQHEGVAKKAASDAEALQSRDLYAEEELNHVFDSVSHDASARRQNYRRQKLVDG